ncbi:hypothetical protein [Paenibacillus lacisoli]|nr:hypothetical protein [Paenibacillus sp. JX-17]
MMQKRQYADHPLLPGITYGLFEGELNHGTRILTHSGEVDSFESWMVLIPSAEIGIYVVANSSDSGTVMHERLVQAVADILLPSAPLPVVEPGENASFPVEQAAGSYSYSISPQHSWGRWVRLLELSVYHVTVKGQQVWIQRPGSTGEGSLFVPVKDGVYQEKGGKQRVWFHKKNGVWQMTGLEGVTMVGSGILNSSLWQLLFYGSQALLWLIVLVVWAVRYIFSWLTGGSRAPFSQLHWVALLFTIYVPVQLMVGLRNMQFGFPGWYKWGICSLPLLASLLAVWMIWSRLRAALGLDKKTIWLCAAAFAAWMFTVFLLYWNMLSIHYV